MNIPNFYCTFLPSLDNQSKINPATQTQQTWAPLQTKKPNPSISTTTKNANPESPKPISSDHDNHNPDQSDQSTRLIFAIQPLISPPEQRHRTTLSRHAVANIWCNHRQGHHHRRLTALFLQTQSHCSTFLPLKLALQVLCYFNFSASVPHAVK